MKPVTGFLIVALLCCSLTGNAESVGGEAEQIPPTVVPETPQSNLYDISFQGGNLVELLQIIKASSAGGINLIWSEKLESEGFLFPRVELKNVTATDLLFMIGSIIDNETGGRLGISQSGDVWSVSVRSFRNIPQNDTKRVVFIKIEDVLERYPLDAITTAIHTGLDMAGVEDESVLKFHPDTCLLVFHGGNEAINIVYSVLGQLKIPASGGESKDETEKH